MEWKDPRQAQSVADPCARKEFNTFEVLLQVFGLLDPLPRQGEKIAHRDGAQTLDLGDNGSDVLDPTSLHHFSGLLQTATRHWCPFSGHLRREAAFLDQPLLDDRVVEGLKPQMAAPRDDRLQQHLGLEHRKDEKVLRRRFLEDFEKGVGGLFPEAVGVLEDHDAHATLEGSEADPILELADLVELDEGPLASNEQDVGMGAPRNLPAGAARIPAVLALGREAVHDLGNLEGHGSFADAGHATKQESVRDLSLPHHLNQKPLCAFLTGNVIDGHAHVRRISIRTRTAGSKSFGRRYRIASLLWEGFLYPARAAILAADGPVFYRGTSFAPRCQRFSWRPPSGSREPASSRRTSSISKSPPPPR